ncbi:hypothetical protein PE066_05045 [Ramlibacter tataouinensis]|uniref:hypothetical protein n=1 Tax=Ramlibacter tataouinensis TaxID=94132 RepID=UPI0022F3F14C|nr:hypothetical protein [Ramlibacter tataouinensis]WBY02907.1 hypothetical protein PE066_05045 [Ramlibacter tataouinensis]
MYAIKLFDVLQKRKHEIEGLSRGQVPDLVSYTLLRAADGGAAVTVCQTEEAAEVSLKVAREWIQNNASDTGAGPPDVLQGEVLIQI